MPKSSLFDVFEIQILKKNISRRGKGSTMHKRVGSKNFFRSPILQYWGVEKSYIKYKLISLLMNLVILKVKFDKMFMLTKPLKVWITIAHRWARVFFQGGEDFLPTKFFYCFFGRFTPCRTFWRYVIFGQKKWLEVWKSINSGTRVITLSAADRFLSHQSKNESLFEVALSL